MLAILLSSCGKKEQIPGGNTDAEKDFSEFVKALETKTVPLFKEMNLAYWNASISGKKEDFEKNAELQNKYAAIFSDKSSFEKLKGMGEIKDPILKR
jgi:peptidyl-dipeptidase A